MHEVWICLDKIAMIAKSLRRYFNQTFVLDRSLIAMMIVQVLFSAFLYEFHFHSKSYVEHK